MAITVKEKPLRASDVDSILERAANGGRIDDDECLALFRCKDLNAIGAAAHAARMLRTDPDVVTYNSDRNINYTNACVTDCKFCAFYRTPGHKEVYILCESDFRSKIKELYQKGGSQILMQGGLHPDLPLEWYEELLRWLGAEWPNLHQHVFSPTEIGYFARITGISTYDVLMRLKAAGMRSLPGGGAEILSDRPRKKISPEKESADGWIDIMRQVHRAGMRGSSTMMFGHVETHEERVEHLRRLRDLQDECGVFTAFICWTFQPRGTQLKDRFCGAWEYMRTAAIARLYLDNIPNHQASWVTQGPKVGIQSLFFGINDLGSTMLEENVVREAGTHYKMDRNDLEGMAKEAGFRPMQRTFFYTPYVHPNDAPDGIHQSALKFPNLPAKLLG